MEKKTPLYDIHVKEGGKMVPFAGYLLPVQYQTGVVKEHLAVRNAAGLFDVSHMGEIVFSGETALATLNRMLTNDFTNMTAGRVRYSVMCNQDGGVIDDLVVYKFSDACYLAVVNAANREKDFAHMSENLLPGTSAEDISDSVAQVALQGPLAPQIAAKLLKPEDIPKKYYTAIPNVQIGGINALISRTGYTGELGYEIYVAAEKAPALWEMIRNAGEEEGLLPCGLGARDTLRLEAAMPLYGNEMDETVTPFEAGLDFGVKMDKDFIGRDALLKAGEPERIRIGLKVTGRGIIREHQDVYLADRKVGVTTSGTYAPYLKTPVAMALVESGCAEEGTVLEADVRGKRVEAQVVPLPFYKREKK